MSLGWYVGFVSATVVLALLPGPNVGLIVATSIAHGRRAGLLTVLGTSAAMVPELALAALGMAGVLTLAGDVFGWVRWAGVVYLVYLGVRAWSVPAVDLTKIEARPRAPRATFLRGFLVSSSNPKTLLFYGAFFPQFVVAGGDVARELALLSASFLAIIATLDCGWALLADRLRGILAARGRLRNRLIGTCYVAAAAALASVRGAA